MTDKIAFASDVTVEGRRLRGSVTLAGSKTWRNGEWLKVDPAALVKADASDVFGRPEHDPTKILGRSSNGTVRFSRTDQGIDYEIDLPNTTFANDLLELVNRGDIRGSSFEIEGLRSKFSTDPDGKRVRTITHIDRLVDVSPVADPAFTNSSVAAFSKESDMPEIAEEPKVEDPAPAKFTEPTGREAATAFAKTLTTDQLEAGMDDVMDKFGDDLRGEPLVRYGAFSEELARRQAADTETRASAERFKALHDLRRGKIAKAPANELLGSEDYSQAFANYLRTGKDSQMAQFAQSIAGTGAEGGYAVPDGFLNRVTETKLAYGGVRQRAEVISTGDGQSLRWPSNNDTANSAAIAAEGVAGAAGADLVFGNITLAAFSYNSNGASNLPLKVSLELIQDAAFDVGAFVGRKLGERIGRKQASDLAVGGGTTLPFGLLSKTPDSMTATKTNLAANEHLFQVNSAYRESGNCCWVMSDTVLAVLFAAVDLNGRPLLMESAAASLGGRPSLSLKGYPIQLEPAAGTLVAFGDIRQGYIIRDVRSVDLLVDPYTASGTRQMTYHAWARMDANIQDAAAYSVSDWTSVTADAVGS